MLEHVDMIETIAQYAKLSASILFFTKINLDDFIHLWSWKHLYTSEKSARISKRMKKLSKKPFSKADKTLSTQSPLKIPGRCTRNQPLGSNSVLNDE